MIVESVDTLLKRGKSVLLVSGTNIAVDSAVQSIASKSRPKPGQVVRVGTPVVPAVAKDHRVALPLLVEARQSTLIDKIADLNQQIDTLNRDARLAALADAERRLDGFDFDAYDTALTLVSNMRAAEQAHATVNKTRERAVSLEHSKSLQIAAALKSKWIFLRAQEMAGDAAVAEIEEDLGDLRSMSGWSRLRNRARAATLRSQLQAAHERRIDARSERRTFEERVKKRSMDPWSLANDSECRVEPSIAQDRLRRDEQRLSKLIKQASEADRQAEQAARRLTTATSRPMPTAEHTKLITAAARKGLPKLRDRLPAFRQDAAMVRQAIEKAHKSLEAAEEQLEKMRRGAEATVIKGASVVACTLAAMAKRRPIRERRLDYVIIDEAAACRLPELVNAVGRAKSGAVLVGDYMQNGPIVEPVLLKDDRLKRYFAPDCFTHFGVTDPIAAGAHPGCAVLNEQRRFGPAVTDLINEAVYDRVLVQRQTDGGEIVLIDVDGLGSELTDIYRTGKYKGRWPVGALLARALTEHHADRGQSFGVVTPFKNQVDATKSLLADSPHGPVVEIGTAHAFQGREFDVVLFDMVEDGRGQIAAAVDRREFNLGGLRIFNVALTRARTRTYLVAQGPAVWRAKRGPLSAVRAGLERGTISLVRATEVLGIDEPTDVGGGAFDDIRAALEGYVRVCGIYDEATTFEPLIHRIDLAKRSIWVWSPWIGKHNLAVQDSLIDAAARGVAVTVLTRPDRGLNEAQRESSQQFRERFGGRIVFQVKMHQKIAVVDGHWTFSGSLNLLSARERAAERTKEFMLEIANEAHAAMILDQQKATDLARPPRCPICGTQMSNVDIRGRAPKREWRWLCDLAREGCHGQQPFAHDEKPHRR